MPELHIRDMALRANTDDGKREFSGVAVPWDEPVDICDWFGEYTEQVERGAVINGPEEMPLAYWRHSEPIGRITAARNGESGWEIDGFISKTPRGDEAYTLLRDGVIDKMSIGFEFVKYREEHDAETGATRLIHEEIRVREVSLVPFPAYDTAQVTAVRHATSKETPVDPKDILTRADLNEVTESVEELNRSVALLQQGGAPATPTPTFRSIGHYVHALVTGDETARRAFEGAVSGDGILADQWIGDIVQLQEQAQPVLQEFTTGVLPAQGLTVEWGKLKEDTTDFDKQLTEGGDLVHGKISVETQTAPIITAGGWSSLSIQAIERTTNINLLDTTWQALALKAARYAERLARKTVLDAVDAQRTAGAVVTADLTTAKGLVALTMDLYEKFDDLDLSMTGLYVARDVFLELYDVQAPKSALQVNGAGADKLGTLTLPAPSADLAGIVVKLFPKAPAGTLFGYDKTSVKSLKASGSPFRVTNDLSVVNLTKPIGMYEFVSSFAQRPAGLVPVDRV